MKETTAEAGKPGYRKPTHLWQDVQAYFLELFQERKNVDVIELKEVQLVTDLDARFKKQYNAEMIAKLLKNAFEVRPGVYVFKRDDFVFKPNPRLIEEGKAVPA